MPTNPPVRDNDLATILLAAAVLGALAATEAWRRELQQARQQGELQHPDDLATPGRW